MVLLTTHFSLLTLFSELRFDRFVHFVFADNAGDALDLLAVARNENACGVSKKATELIGSFVVADEDLIAHGKLLAVDVKALFGNERCDGAFAFLVQSDA